MKYKIRQIRRRDINNIDENYLVLHEYSFLAGQEFHGQTEECAGNGDHREPTN